MKILKGVFTITLFFNLIVSCIADDISDSSEVNAVEKVQATTDNENNTVDKTKKG